WTSVNRVSCSVGRDRTERRRLRFTGKAKRRQATGACRRCLARTRLAARRVDLSGGWESRGARAELDRVRPEPLKPAQRAMRRDHILALHDALRQRCHVALMHALQLLMQSQALLRQADTDR